MYRWERLAVLAEGRLGVLTSKTAACVIRYDPGRVACVVDSTKAGSTAGEILGFGGGIPVVGSLAEALRHEPDTFLLGVAPSGGILPAEWRSVILEALESGLNVINGLHTILGEDTEMASAAAGAGVWIWDVRIPAVSSGISTGAVRNRTGKVVLTVGSDARSGKMTVALELVKFMVASGRRAAFVPTGQTGVILKGGGLCVDRLPGDFMAGATETMTMEALEGNELVVVEGQGSLNHPAFSGVALGILHGCCPDAMVLCHQASRLRIRGFPDRLPPLDRLVDLYERAAAPVYPSRMAAVAVNTFDLDPGAAGRALEQAGRVTGLPAFDVIRSGAADLASVLEEKL
jgi:uncharacterized NAD-dependent epimerase/dehydratase family protein